MNKLKRRSVLAGLAALGAAGSALAITPPQPLPHLEVGQMWTIRDVPEHTRLVVARTEAEGTIVHISVFNVDVPASALGPASAITMAHLPFARSALAGSVLLLLGTGARPADAFEDGYAQWKNAKGGVFTLSVKEVIDALIDIRSKAKP